MKNTLFLILITIIFIPLFAKINAEHQKNLLDTPTITILPLENSYCAGSSMIISFQVSSDFEQDNIFIAELSDENGNFNNPLEIGTLNSNTSGIIQAKLPKSLTEGNAYRVRIKATNPQIISEDNGTDTYIFELPDMTINGELEPCKQMIYTYSTTQNLKYSYLWSVNGGYFITDSTKSNVQIEWGTSQEYGYLTLIKTNILNACSDTTTVQIALKSAPLTQIIAGQSKACIAEIAEYTAASSSVVPSNWNVYGGSLLPNSNNNTAYVLWTQLGKGWVELTKTNQFGCIGKDTFFVQIYPVPYATFTGPQTVVENSSTAYKANSEENLRFHWNVTGGNITQEHGDSIIVKWGKKGSGKISLIETYIGSGCSDTIEKNITILEALPDFQITGKKEVCPFSLQNYSIELTYNVIIKWTAQNGNIIGPDNDYTVTINWQQPGNGSVHCQLISIQSSDTSNSELLIKIRDLPNITINEIPKFCLNDGPYELNFAKPQGGTYQGKGIENNIFYPENVGSGKHTITYTYTDNFGCSNSQTVQIEIFPNPTKPELNTDEYGFYTNYENGNIWYVNGIPVEGNSSNRLHWSEIKSSTCTVWVVHVDSNGCKSPQSNQIEVGVNEFNDEIYFFPNPTQDYLIISIKNNKNINATATIYDVFGNKLKSVFLTTFNNTNDIIIDLNNFGNNIYFIKLILGDNIIIGKFMVNK